MVLGEARACSGRLKRGPWGCVEGVCVRGISQRKLGWLELGVAAELRQKSDGLLALGVQME